MPNGKEKLMLTRKWSYKINDYNSNVLLSWVWFRYYFRTHTILNILLIFLL